LLVGFLPDNDCAPLIVAQQLGLYAKHGLEVELECQASWKNIHDKLLHNQLDAAHAPAALPFLINLGLTPEKRPCVAGLILSLQGNTITVSRQLWERGARDAATFSELLARESRKRIYTFGVPCPLASQYSLLCQWLRSVEVVHSSVRIESFPVWQLFPMLKLGYLDGFCAGEPWGSVAVQAGAGACVATSNSLASLHPEKVLMVRKDFAESRAEEHERLIAALLEACRLCDQREYRKQICALLAHPKYVNAPLDCIEAGLLGSAEATATSMHPINGLNIFYRYRANEPTAARARWITGRLFELLRWNSRPASLNGVFRRDVFCRAREKVRTMTANDGPAASMSGRLKMTGGAPA
jgi:ABC-type nitrate/sulfonate/bicarbonate transport system substrate-binding protein